MIKTVSDYTYEYCNSGVHAKSAEHAVHGSATSKRESEQVEIFHARESNDLVTESAIERANQALMKFLNERGQQAQSGKGTSLEEVRRQLGL